LFEVIAHVEVINPDDKATGHLHSRTATLATRRDSLAGIFFRGPKSRFPSSRSPNSTTC
jgi:hypothetical protein